MKTLFKVAAWLIAIACMALTVYYKPLITELHNPARSDFKNIGYTKAGLLSKDSADLSNSAQKLAATLPKSLSKATVTDLCRIAKFVDANFVYKEETLSYIISQSSWLTSNDYKQHNNLIGLQFRYHQSNKFTLINIIEFKTWQESLQLLGMYMHSYETDRSTYVKQLNALLIDKDVNKNLAYSKMILKAIQ
jgi:hypothetical protein